MKTENIRLDKIQLRKEIIAINKSHSSIDLSRWSKKIMDILEGTDAFRKASSIFIYNNLPREVETMSFIDKWVTEKEIYLPVTLKNDLVFRKYTQNSCLSQSDYGIFEPEGSNFSDYDSIDLVIIPGIGFDRQMNRMGRGKGYYDRFLTQVPFATKIGICFDFQLFDNIPNDDKDVKMDCVISEKGAIVCQ